MSGADSNKPIDYQVVIDDDESLGMFIQAMREVQDRFCEAMTEGTEFTIRLEIHGAAGRIIHLRNGADGFRRPRIGAAAKEDKPPARRRA